MSVILCDICHEPIEGSYYELPDGLIVCADSDCLEEWAVNYQKRMVADDY